MLFRDCSADYFANGYSLVMEYDTSLIEYAREYLAPFVDSEDTLDEATEVVIDKASFRVSDRELSGADCERISLEMMGAINLLIQEFYNRS